MLLFAATLGACAGACASDDDLGVEWRRSEIDAPGGEGISLYHYPGSAKILARGAIADGVAVGEWTYYDHSGKPFARGAYAADGKRTGPWILWKRDGTISDERRSVRRDGGTMYDTIPGAQDFESQYVPKSQRDVLWRFFRMHWPTWTGSGFYSLGFWERALSAEQLLQAQRVGPVGRGDERNH